MRASFASRYGTTGPRPLPVVVGLGVLACVVYGLVQVEMQGLFLGLLAFLGLALAGQMLFTRFCDSPEERQFLRRNFLPAFLAVVVVTFLVYGLLLVVEWKGYAGFFMDDEVVYDLRGQIIASSWSFGVKPPYEATYTNNFVFVNAAIYWLFGHNPVLVRLLNATTGIWLAAAASGIARIAFPGQRRVADVTFWLVALSPVVLVWTTSQVRDPQVAFGTAMVFWAVAKVLESGRLGTTPFGLAGLAWVWYMRPLSAGFCVTAVLGGLILRALSRRAGRDPHARSGRSLIPTIVLIATIAASYSYWIPIYQAKYEEYGTFEGLGEDESFSKKFLEDEGRNPLNFAVSAARLFFIPTPFWVVTVGNFNSAVQSVVGVAWYLLLPFMLTGWLGAVTSRNRRLSIVNLFCLGMMVLAASSLFTRYADPVRVRVPALAFLMMFSAHGIQLFKDARPGTLLRNGVFAVFAMEWAIGLYYLFSAIGT